MAALEDAFAFVQAFCARHALAAEDALRLKLVVEELFTNTVRHGGAVEGDAPIRIALQATPEDVVVVYEDEAEPFDPTGPNPGPHPKRALDDPGERVGGVGLRLLAQIVEDVRYVREEGRNRVRLRLLRGS